MVHHSFDINLGSEATIFAFGDLQFGMPGFDEEAWQEFKNEFKRTPNAYAIGLGDYGDALRPTMMTILTSAMAKDDSAKQQLDDHFRQTHDKIVEKMEFLKGHLIGLHNGHHCWDFIDGTNSDQRLCTALKTRYLGWMASTRLNLSVYRGGSILSYTMVSMHGTGGGGFTSTDVGFLEKKIAPAWGADHFIKGHSCKSHTSEPFEKKEIRRNGPCGVLTRLVRCMGVGGFHQGYTDGHSSSYVERSGFLPQPIGWGVIKIRPKKGVAISKETGLSKSAYVLDIDHFNRHPLQKDG